MAEPVRPGRGKVVAVIPTLGRSPLLAECLEALRLAGERAEVALEIVLVDQGERPLTLAPEARERVDRLVRRSRNEGFAGGTNRGIAAAQGVGSEDRARWVAAVNDDAVVEPGWLGALLDALEAHPEAAAAQGLNRTPDGTRVDGAGIAWNRWHQAVQIGHGEDAEGWAGGTAKEIFGVSATAAVYRWSALDAVRRPNGDLFDTGLESYYEDVDLACRLRAAGFSALYIPQAQARHGASVTGRTLGPAGLGRLRRLRGNRYRVLARQPGFWRKLPVALLRDGLDLVKAGVTLRWVEAAGVVLGWGWAAQGSAARGRAFPGQARGPAPTSRPLVGAAPRGRPSDLPPFSKGGPRGDFCLDSDLPPFSKGGPRGDFCLDSDLPPFSKGGVLPGGLGDFPHPDPDLALSAVVIHWRNEDLLERLLATWPEDPQWELLVVDNSDSTAALEAANRRPGVRWVHRGANLGFAGGVNRGVAAARGAAVLILNPDVEPEPGAFAALLAGLEAHPEAAGLAPRLVGEDGAPQAAWQLRPLPSPIDLLLQTLLIATGGGPTVEPPAGTPVAQPAAAALLIRRAVLEAVGGLDEGFYPAWFEDVDLAKRLQDGGYPLLYWPPATFRHGLGASVPHLGYGRFLWVYYRNLERYLGKHHGAGWVLLARLTLPLGMGLRLLLLPLRKPRRAASRGAAAGGLLRVMVGALSGWRWFDPSR